MPYSKRVLYTCSRRKFRKCICKKFQNFGDGCTFGTQLHHKSTHVHVAKFGNCFVQFCKVVQECTWQFLKPYFSKFGHVRWFGTSVTKYTHVHVAIYGISFWIVHQGYRYFHLANVPNIIFQNNFIRVLIPCVHLVPVLSKEYTSTGGNFWKNNCFSTLLRGGVI